MPPPGAKVIRVADATSRARAITGLVLAAVVLAGCSALHEAAPTPTPQDFPGLAGQLAAQGVIVGRPVSGEAGCDDPALIPTAIGFDVSGLGVPSPIRAHVYLFANPDAYTRRRAQVDACTATWTTDPGEVEFIDSPPFVLVVQGPLPPAFKAALVRAVTTAAGNGG